MEKFKHIAIEGPMGAGKTTLANLLSPMLNARVILELGKENPFLELFLDFPDRYAIAMQLHYLLDRFRQNTIEIPKILKSESVISDCMFERDQIFASLGLKPDQLAIYQQIYSNLFDQIHHPDIVIYLHGNTNTLVSRLKARGDDTVKVWTPQFIDKLRQVYEEFFSSYSFAPVIVIEIEKNDFLKSADRVSKLIEKIVSM